jgi:hypothetical protein
MATKASLKQPNAHGFAGITLFERKSLILFSLVSDYMPLITRLRIQSDTE